MGPGATYPCEYMWREVKPPTTQWTLLTEGPVCGKRPVALFTMVGLSGPAVTWEVIQTEAGIPGDSFTYDFTPTITGGTAPFTYSWDFADGSPPETIELPTKVWARNGWANPETFLVTLTVTDANLLTGTFAANVVVTFNE